VRYLVPVLGLLLLIGALAGVKWAQISSLITAGAAAEAAGPPPEAISSGTSQTMSWERTLSAVGSISAAQGVTVSNDLPGLVTRIRFESGDVVKQGEVLVELDTRVERAQLATAEARAELAEQNVKRTRALAARGGVPRSQLDNDESQLKSARAEVDALRAQISRKIVRAPFAGKLGIRAVNLGQYLSSGTTLTTLESLDAVYVDFSLPQHALSQLTPGMPVRIEAGELNAKGTLDAVDPRIDQATRSIRVRASVSNADQDLRPGMFVNVGVVLPEEASVVAVPATSVVHAPYGDSVFVLEPLDAKDKQAPAPAGKPIKEARQQFVRVGEQRGDFVAVLEGLEPGREVVTAGAFKLFNGAKVIVDNGVGPDPKLSPRPENR
jgi:membrane fusion protein, multidrug efflux system